jgi:hypothetical protein
LPAAGPSVGGRDCDRASAVVNDKPSTAAATPTTDAAIAVLLHASARDGNSRRLKPRPVSFSDMAASFASAIR